jgi:hypothetical protein
LKYLEDIITITIIIAFLLLTVYLFERTCDQENPYYVVHCKNNILFHPKVIGDEPPSNISVGDKLFWEGKHEEALPYYNKVLEKESII